MKAFKFKLLGELNNLEASIESLQNFAKSLNSASLLDEDENGESTLSPEEAASRTDEYIGLMNYQLKVMQEYRACLIGRLRLLGIDIDRREPYLHF